MIAVDTSVVVRYLTNDHAEQAARARRLIEGEDVLITVTVVLEAEWVLRSVYHFAPHEVLAALRAFAGLPRVGLDRPEAVFAAMQGAALGMDFADALHLSLSDDCEVYATFDADLKRRADQHSGLPVRLI